MCPALRILAPSEFIAERVAAANPEPHLREHARGYTVIDLDNPTRCDLN
jgi:hypothetical protein